MSEYTAFAEQYVARLSPEQLDQFYGTMRKIARAQEEYFASVMEKSGQMDSLRQTLAVFADNMDRIVRRSGLLDNMAVQLNQISKTLSLTLAAMPVPQVEVPQHVIDGLQNLNSLKYSREDLEKFASYGALLRADPESEQIRAELESIEDLPVSADDADLVPRQDVQLGLKWVIFLLSFAGSLWTAGAPDAAKMLIETLGVDLGVLPAIAAAHYGAKTIYPIVPVAKKEDSSTNN